VLLKRGLGVGGMGRALAGFIIGVLIVLAAAGFAMHYGLIPRGIQIVGFGNAGSSGGGSSGSAVAYTYTGNSTGAAVASDVFNRVGSYIAGFKGVVAGFFTRLLGSSLADAVTNLIVLVIVSGVVYWLVKFFKWIIIMVVAIDALLIVLKYVLMVI
jgi:hypothetical protein